jgi:hypothetical protein
VGADHFEHQGIEPVHEPVRRILILPAHLADTGGHPGCAFIHALTALRTTLVTAGGCNGYVTYQSWSFRWLTVCILPSRGRQSKPSDTETEQWRLK